MKIYLMNKEKIEIYNLPEKIEDFYTIYYKINNINYLITIEAKEGRWQLKENETINIMENNTRISNAILEEYKNYILKINDLDEYITLYTHPFIDKQLFKIENINKITIGSNERNNIQYKNKYIDSNLLVIENIDNRYILQKIDNTKCNIYVNNYKVDKKVLEIGDVIFINGLKIIWMRKFLEINNPNSNIQVSGIKQYNEILINNNVEIETNNNITLYDDENYFRHIPRIREKLENKTILIDAPPKMDTTEELPILLALGTSLTMMASSLFTAFTIYDSIHQGNKTFVQSLPQIILCVTMLIGSVVMPRIISSYNKNKRKKREELRQTKYKEYLAEREMKINQEKNRQMNIMYANNPDLQQCIEVIKSKNKDLWNREILDEDFLSIRLGLGDQKPLLTINAPEKHFTLDEDNLLDLAYEVKDRSILLNNVPITYNLTSNQALSIIENCSYINNYVNYIITQIIANHSPDDVKIIFLTDDENKWNYIKFLPHSFSEDKQIRFYATNQKEANDISLHLEAIFNRRKELLKKGDDEIEINRDRKFKNFLPYYLIICDSYKVFKNTTILDLILEQEENYGFTFLAIDKTIKNLPNKCTTFIQINEKNGCILKDQIDSSSQTQFNNEPLPLIDMNELAVKLFNIPTVYHDKESQLPNSISFLEMYGVNRVEQFNLLNRWQINNPVLSLQTPIGVHKNEEIFYLDLHEKYHGPHGLIAGMTGSGKSEFIITYILSLALNYHPYEVQFVLIDYKGGGLTGAFENKETGIILPHLAGTITNLDTNSINRALVSIESELKRRQKIFNDTKSSLGEGTLDIYKYQKLYREGIVKEPMSHLFIISDEFAELKQQQPDFMQQLITTARIGRSLGVHLILATQKPSGVVNDQIWSNSKFKICLKVQDRSDSTEMLKKPDAASLKEVGRFFLQVGYDDYFDIGQSGWAGSKYTPDKTTTKINDSIDFINNTGFITKSINNVITNENQNNYGDQLTNIVKYIYNIATKENIRRTKLWLDKLPEIIKISDLIKKYNYKKTPFKITPIIGEYDNPTKQEQGLLTLNLSENGNTLIIGMTGSGKEKLLTTLIYSLITNYTTEEVNIYAIDCGSETLIKFAKAKQVGSVANTNEQEKIFNIIDYAYDELEKRKELFVDYNGSYNTYIELSKEKLPLLVFIINSYEVFQETYPQYADNFQSILRDGSKYGIVFILSSSTVNGVKYKTQQYFTNKICMQLPSESDYREIVNAPRGLTPFKCLGRGIVLLDEIGQEFQTATITEDKNLTLLIKETIAKLNEILKNDVKLKAIPDIVTLENTPHEDKVVIGYNIKNKDIETYDFDKNRINLILSDVLSDKMPFIHAISHEIPNIEVIDFVGLFNTNIPSIKDNFKEEFIKILNEKEDKIYMIVGVGQFTKKMDEEGVNIARQVFNTKKLIFVDNYNAYKLLQPEQLEINNSDGLWLGTGIASQMALNVLDITLETRKLEGNYLGFKITDGKFEVIKYIIENEGDAYEK